jgi:hypothetical protein
VVAVLLLLEQPASTMNAHVAAAKLKRARERRVIGTPQSDASAVSRSISVRGETGGIWFGMPFGRLAVEAAVVNVTVAVPGAVTGDVTEQLPCGMLPLHVIATEPVNPPRAPIVAVAVPGVP